MPERIITCPSCGHESTRITYRCSTSGSENGNVTVNEDDNFLNEESTDSETNDCSDYEYECPECSHIYDNSQDVIDNHCERG